ncbi:glutamine--fructose-6-phosphate transaminase (isomerizing) [Candidatus Daviesbacteria bacterium]|nr:glutamine--fructose-6-phosphate transaminase (isomerizing) [Candidatus Daviesbacteria bacterium]
MCGIFGYIGNNDAFKVVLGGLTRLEYRGYDSWGISTLINQSINTIKSVGSIGSSITDGAGKQKAKVAIGHTRWATHGGVSKNNAHPHASTDNSFVLAQNGIFENFLEVKKELSEKGFKFISETDTEVIVCLIEDIKKNKNLSLKDAAREAFKRLEGRNTIIILDKNGTIYAVKNGSPLVLGTNDAHEYYLSSDALSFSDTVSKIVVIENFQLVEIGGNGPKLFDVQNGKQLSLSWQNLEIAGGEISKGNFEHFMLKEIREQPETIKIAVQMLDEDMLGKLKKSINKSTTVYTIGSGTAGVAAALGAIYLRKIAKINAISLIGAEANEYYNLFKPDDLIIVPSQSGETADVLETLEAVKAKNAKIASFINMPGSTISRISQFPFMANAGPEIAVATTKIFTSQAVWFYLLANFLNGTLEQAKEIALKTSGKLEDWFNSDALGKIENLAEEIINEEDLYLFGKSEYYQIAREGMIKLIEVANIHAHALPSGDLKHYVIAMIQPKVHAIALVPDGDLRSDVLNAVGQIKTRGGTIIGISPASHSEFDYFIEIPKSGDLTAVLAVMPLQLLAYYLALKRKKPIDKPRNIAKSVTVK